MFIRIVGKMMGKPISWDEISSLQSTIENQSEIFERQHFSWCQFKDRISESSIIQYKVCYKINFIISSEWRLTSDDDCNLSIKAHNFM